MANPTQTRTRSQRVAALELPRGRWSNLLGSLRRGSVLLRIGLCLVTALALMAMTRAWNPPREFRPDRPLRRDIVARTRFHQEDEEATREQKRVARENAVAVYDHDPTQITQLKAKLVNDVTQLLGADDFSEVDQQLWRQFTPPRAEGTPAPTEAEQQEQFQRFKQALSEEDARESFNAAIDEVFADVVKHGLIQSLPEAHDANRQQIFVRPLGENRGWEAAYPLSEVMISDVTNRLQRELTQKLPSLEVADRVFAWVKPRLPVTLRLNEEETQLAQDEAAANVEPVIRWFEPGERIARARAPVSPPTEEELKRLELEYQQELENRSVDERLGLALAVLGMYGALFTVCGFFLYRLDPRYVTDLGKLVTVLVTILATVGAMLLTYPNGWRAEVIPLLLFGMTMAVVSRQDVAVLLSAALTLVIVIAVGHDLVDAIVLQATVTGAVLALDSVRTRSKLLAVGFVAAVVGALTTVGVGVVAGQELMWAVRLAAMVALWAVIAGSLMTCLLPLVERVFGVQTDLSLIELGDPAHPLLQELVRRAPGTYNHSITVASLAQAAAESIGARGLLVRVGAYFHDIGKMLKPGYFVENQTHGDNRHEALVPAMSTLVIIAHVKDGADLARQNNLPECIVDFIQQHHGTTLVEYFYRQAAVQKSVDPDAADVDESSFRYPGPKPQTKEAGVLMLADAVESASRVLVEPTPARIENLVEDLTRKRLDDGQFDECGLTLQELRKIGDSLVKSLTAVYHGRVKYPDQPPRGRVPAAPGPPPRPQEAVARTTEKRA